MPDYVRKYQFPSQHRKVLEAITKCRTPEMGGQLFHCSHCGKDHSTSHGCGDRHCPSCQGRQARLWLDKQREALLPVPYFHTVFTLPHTLNPLIRYNRAELYKLLFDCASATLLQFAKNRFGGQAGLTAVLHTWSQRLTEHYHLHCIIPGGAFDQEASKWTSANPNYCFPVKALSKVFRAKYRDGLWRLFDQGRLNLSGANEAHADRKGFRMLIHTILAKKWVVYAKAPFGGPAQVLAYLSRYTHRVAISDARILAVNLADKTVTFKYRDYADASKKKVSTIKIEDFIHRFRSHILPPRFCKIRHYGILSNATRKLNVTAIKAIIGQTDTPALVEPSTQEVAQVPACPHCKNDTLVLVKSLPRRVFSRRKKPP
ncbi:MAG: IS91 family transposase [Cyclobacteriaceae bacterium]